MSSRGSSKLQVWLSKDETEQWSDYEFRETLLISMRHRTLARGRKFFQLFGADGRELIVVQA